MRRLGKKGQEIHTSSQYATTPGFIEVLRYTTIHITRRRLILPLCSGSSVAGAYTDMLHISSVSTVCK